VISFIKKIPQAITLSAIRPYPSDIKHLLSLFAACEINLLLLLFIISLIWRKKTDGQHKAIIYFFLFFSFTLLLSIGFSVNNLGAIVRYRSIILPLIVVLIATQVNWSRIGSFVQKH
jgi:hypothetical protein